MHLGTESFQFCITPILKFISVLLQLQSSRATPPLNIGQLKRFLAQIFIFITGKDRGNATRLFQTFSFLGHTNLRVVLDSSYLDWSAYRPRPTYCLLCSNICL